MLVTIGYEGASPRNFLKTLEEFGIDLVVDVRDRAQSRRAGFSKTALRQSLADVGIEYVHYPELGDPKEGREAARAGDYAKFRRTFSAVLETEAAKVAIDHIIECAAERTVCMLCYEREPTQCHRKLVSDRIGILSDLKARHLGVRVFGDPDQQVGRMHNPS